MTDRATRDDPPDYSRLGEGPLDACHRGGTFAHIVARVVRRKSASEQSPSRDAARGSPTGPA